MKAHTASLSSIIEKAFYQSFFAINITNLEGRMLHVNDAFLKLYNFRDEKEILGRLQETLSSPKTPGVVMEDMWVQLNKNRPWSGEMTNISNDGQEVFIHLTMTPLFEGEKKIGYMGFSMDRSQQVILERQLLHANKLVVLGTLGAGVAHELNNPLTSISLEAEYIQEKLASASEFGEGQLNSLKAASDNILRGVDRMNKVIEHLRVYSRKEDPRDLEIISMRSLIEDSFLFLDKQLKNRGIEVRLKIDEEIRIFGRRMDMESVIHNLLTNSRDAFNHRTQSKKSIDITATKTDDNWMLLDYRDNAGGISSSIIERIFDPFFTTKQEGEGTGLGLAITKKIIVEFGGIITCESVESGTRFLIRLPLAESGRYRTLELSERRPKPAKPLKPAKGKLPRKLKSS